MLFCSERLGLYARRGLPAWERLRPPVGGPCRGRRLTSGGKDFGSLRCGAPMPCCCRSGENRVALAMVAGVLS